MTLNLSLDNLINLFIHYKYLIIFPIVVVEGPIITIICGFLASLGYLDFRTALFLVIIGDLVGDSFYYSLGRWGRKPFVIRYGHLFGVSADRLEKLESLFKKFAGRTFAIGKVSHGLGGLLLVASGVAKVPYWTMIKYNVIPTILKSLTLIIIGYYFGKAYIKIDHYLNYASLGVVVLLIILYYVLLRTKLLAKLIDKL